MKKAILVLTLIVSVCGYQTVLGQKRVKPIKTEIDLFPLENTITLEFTEGDGSEAKTYEEKLYVLLSKKDSKSKKGEYLVSTEAGLLTSIRALKNGAFVFESARMSRKAKRQLLKNVKGNPSEQPLLTDLKRSRVLRVYNIKRP
jgi:hypothetical protein